MEEVEKFGSTRKVGFLRVTLVMDNMGHIVIDSLWRFEQAICIV